MEELELFVTVPYEINIDAEGINLDSFTCSFDLLGEDITYSIPLKRKKDFYLLNIPKNLAFLNGISMTYNVVVFFFFFFLFLFPSHDQGECRICCF